MIWNVCRLLTKNTTETNPSVTHWHQTPKNETKPGCGILFPVLFKDLNKLKRNKEGKTRI